MKALNLHSVYSNEANEPIRDLDRHLTGINEAATWMAEDIVQLRSFLRELADDIADNIDGGEECTGRDQMLSGWIRQIEHILKETA